MGIFSKWVESLDYQYEILSSCSRHKSPRSKCSSCAESCDAEAISFENNLPVINHSNCTECGKCIPACPVQAMAGIFPKRDMLQNYLMASEKSIPSVKELLVYARKGIQGIISETELSDDWKERIAETNNVLSILGEPTIQVDIKKLNKAEITYTRRELFFAWKKDTQSLMKEMAPASWRFNQKDLDLAKYYPSHQFAEIYLDVEKCTLCKACQFLCDKKSLQITEGAFLISAQTCSACRLCEDICPEKAIHVTEKISFSAEMEHTFYKKKCPTCRQEFDTLSDNNEKCVPCTMKEKYLILSN